MTKRVLVLVEGQTEEHFVKRVLAPALLLRQIDIRPTPLVTKRVKSGPSFKGGVTSFGKFDRDVRRLPGDRNALVTTMLDYNGLPGDFPGVEQTLR